MADISDVQNVLAGLIASWLYPSGTANSSLVGFPVRVGAGWPPSGSLDSDLSKGIANVTIYATAQERKSTRYQERWQTLGRTPSTVTLQQNGQVVTVTGNLPPQGAINNLAVTVGNSSYRYSVQTGDTLNSIASALATLVARDYPGTVSAGATVTLPVDAPIGELRSGGGGQAIKIVKSQEQVFQITLWCSTPAQRAELANVIDPNLADLRFIVLPDGYRARIVYQGSPQQDLGEKARLYRRDFRYCIDFATTKVIDTAEVIAGGVNFVTPPVSDAATPDAAQARLDAKSLPTLNLDFTRSANIPAGWKFSRASAATCFGADGLMKTAAGGEPRIDHDGAVSMPRGWLIETAQTNALLNSDQIERWSLTGATAVTDGTFAPDGKTLARSLREDVSNQVHAASQSYNLTTSGSQWTYWTRLKPGTRSVAMVMLTDGATSDYCSATFDLNARSVLSTFAGKGAWSLRDAVAIPLANGWVECRVTGLVSSATTIRATTYLCAADGSKNYQGDGISGLYVGGAQLEAGGFGTSYVPTTSAAATRAPDLLTTTDLSWLNPDEGTLLIDAAFVGVAGGGAFVFSLDDGTSNGIGLYKVNGSGSLNAYSGSGAGVAIGRTVKDRERFCAGIAWSGRGASASVAANGVAAVRIDSASAISPAAFSLGSARGGAFGCNLWVRSVRYWPRRMSDSELSGLTALR